jgi:hypothetical protein
MFLLLALLACDRGFDAVAISPIYGWVDGCNAVAVTGHGFGDDVTAMVGGQPLRDAAPARGLLTRGYRLDGTVPPAARSGTVDVVVTTGGASDTITGSGGYTYVACPQRAYVETIDTSEGAPGALVTLNGCSLDTALRVRLLAGDGSPARAADGTTPVPAPLVSVCGTARAAFQVPAVPEGAYFVQLLREDDIVLAGEVCTAADSGTTSDSGSSDACAPIPFTVGAAR